MIPAFGSSSWACWKMLASRKNTEGNAGCPPDSGVTGWADNDTSLRGVRRSPLAEPRGLLSCREWSGELPLGYSQIRPFLLSSLVSVSCNGDGLAAHGHTSNKMRRGEVPYRISPSSLYTLSTHRPLLPSQVLLPLCSRFQGGYARRNQSRRRWYSRDCRVVHLYRPFVGRISAGSRPRQLVQGCESLANQCSIIGEKWQRIWVTTKIGMKSFEFRSTGRFDSQV